MKYVLCINGRYYKTDIEDGSFFDFLEAFKQEDFSSKCVNEKELLAAYIKKASQLFERERQIEALLKRIEVDLSKDSV